MYQCSKNGNTLFRNPLSYLAGGRTEFFNVGAFPTVMTFLPFLSAGGNYIVVCYAMLGIVLSVYKNKNIYPKHVCIGNEKMTV